jgi:hypothetical protein
VKRSKTEAKKRKQNSGKKCLFCFISQRSEKVFYVRKRTEYEAKKYLKAKKQAKRKLKFTLNRKFYILTKSKCVQYEKAIFKIH